MKKSIIVAAGFVATLFLVGCAGQSAQSLAAGSTPDNPDQYVIGAGDSIQVFVWQHPEVSVTVPVRPDGRISTPLVEDMQAVGKTPTQLSRDIEKALGEYIRSPTVNVIVTNFVGTFGTQIRVVGQAELPKAIPYRQDMTLLDVMIAVGGLTKNASGNRAKIVRRSNGKQIEIPVRIDDLLNKGKISANVAMRPGDVLIIPESFL
jgi:polysaccharide export outer membrane protein